MALPYHLWPREQKCFGASSSIHQHDDMADQNDEVLDIFTRTRALQQGHFVLRSGLHSGHFFQCAQVCQDMAAVTRLTELMLPTLNAFEFDTVLAPAMGGLVIGQEVARQTGKRYIFAEKVDDRLAIRRGFKFSPGEKVLIVEDVITRGGRVQEALDLIAQGGGTAVAVALLVDRSEGKASFTVPHLPLLQMSFPTYAADNLPAELAAVPVSKPGS
ncbi:MAG: orotate phosphoribosyltransferase [Verrucomicrobiia bacterium]|tara:strand:+ start:7168 stop:7815 length:648 start_codon:yes stop_codon:yes gene_type:complete